MHTQNQFTLDIAFHPGETLKEKLEEINMSPKEFAIRTSLPEKTIISLLKLQRDITADMAIVFEDVLQIPAFIWLHQQNAYNAYFTRQNS